MNTTRCRRGERGVVLVLALLLIVAGTIIGIAAMSSSDIEMMISGNQRSIQQVFDAAEAGLDVGINAFFVDAPPHGSVRPPIGELSKGPWGLPSTEDLGNGFGYTVWVTDMQVSKSPPPGYDPGAYRSFFYRIRSIGRESSGDSDIPRSVREADQVVGVVYRIK
jgi:hypothetical protein